MFRKLSIGLGLAAIALGVAGSASAQQSRYLYPVERGVLESHLDLQYSYSRFDLGPTDLDISILSIEGQYAFGDRLEVGVNVPFVAAQGAAFGAVGSDEMEFGDIILSSKLKLLGVGKAFGLAAYANFTLPTHSGDLGRDYTIIQTGGAAEATFLGFAVGGNAQAIFLVNDDIDDVILLGLNAYGRVPIFPMFSLVTALEYYNSVKPDADQNALVITPGLEFGLSIFHAGASARVAINDEAKGIVGGRAALLLNAGIRL